MSSEQKNLIFCCFVGEQRSVLCAEKARQNQIEADRLENGWLSLFEVTLEQARARLIQNYLKDHLIFISNDIEKDDEQRLKAILENSGISYEFILLFEALKMAYKKRLPNFSQHNRDQE